MCGLTKRIGVGDIITEEQKRLVTDNHNLIYSFLTKYNLTIEEHYGLAAIGLCKAGLTYNGDKSKFSTYAYTCMFNHVMAELRKENSFKRIPTQQIVYYQAEVKNDDGEITSFMNFIPSGDDIEGETLSKISFQEYVEELNSRDKRIVGLFADGYMQREISDIVGCSQSQVSKVKRRLEQCLIR